MKNTTAIGNEFRDEIFEISKIISDLNLKKEKNIDGKIVDIYFEEKDLYAMRNTRFVVECKFREKKISRSLISKILNEYNAIKHGFDKLIIISNHDLPPNCRETLEKWTEYDVTFKSKNDYTSLIINFQHYIKQLLSKYNNSKVKDYYIPPISSDGKELESEIFEWLEKKSDAPIAILGEYGMGKTSLAIKLASDLANMYLKNEKEIIPVYIELGKIISEQSIEGLISKHFVADNSLKGFTYHQFLELHKQGKILIILDGFDEMKHSMSFDDFKYNIKQINALAKKNSKVVILGRPNSFLSRDEHDLILRGEEYVGDKKIGNPDFIKYIEKPMGAFTKEHINNFINTFSKCNIDDIKRDNPKINIENRIIDIKKSSLFRIMEKPLHTSMVCEIAFYSQEDISKFNSYDLYKRFINLIYEREMEKPSRKKINKEKRVLLIEEIAFQTWVDSENAGFSVSVTQTPHSPFS